jgi:hypothetical protein
MFEVYCFDCLTVSEPFWSRKCSYQYMDDRNFMGLLSSNRYMVS